jgi:ketosteroid isomerase-like protein
MISPDLEQRIRDGFARWNRGAHTFDSEWTHPDLEIHSVASSLSGSVYRGREGLERWVADMEESFDEWQLEIDELDEVSPGRVLGIGAVHLRGRGSGVTVDQPCAWLLDHVDGVLTRFEPFLNRVDEAREIAAGTSR